MAQKPKKLYRVKPCGNGTYNAVVRWESNGKRHRKYFESAKKAQGWADAQAIEAQNVGLGVLGMTDELRVEAQQAAVLIAPFGRSILDAARLAVKHWTQEQTSKTAKEALERLIASKPKCSELYRNDLKNRLAKFVVEFGNRKLSEIPAREVRTWLNDLPLSAASRNTVRRRLSVLWSFAIENEWCRENIFDRIGTAREELGTIGILTPTQAARLLFHAPRRVVPHLAIGLFCGLRRTELERLCPQSIRWNSPWSRRAFPRHTGLVEASVTKTRGAARRFIKIRPNLRAWLVGCGPLQQLTPQQFRDGLDTAIDGAKIIPWPNNALRHSFCSYALEHFRDVEDLTLEMGHTNPQTLFARYRELVTPADASEYWRLTPSRAQIMSRTLPPR